MAREIQRSVTDEVVAVDERRSTDKVVFAVAAVVAGAFLAWGIASTTSLGTVSGDVLAWLIKNTG